MHYRPTDNLMSSYDQYLERKIGKVMDVINDMPPAVYTRKKGGVRLEWVLRAHGVVNPRVPGSVNDVHQGWQEMSTGERVLVHYIEGFGWILEEMIRVR